MKRTALFVMVLAASACWAQPNAEKTENSSSNVVVRPAAPTATDLYCSGFVSREQFPETNIVVGSKVLPAASRFVGADTIFLSGQGLQVGQTLRLIRRIKDRNGTENFDGQRKLLTSEGSTWLDAARVKVTNMVDGYAVAQIVYSCDDIELGDIAMPFEERSAPAFSHKAHDFAQFGVPTASVTGKIVGAKGFDYLLGTNSRIYVNLGANHNLRVGDYLRITRGNAESELAPVDKASRKATIVDETTDNMPKVPRGIGKDLPRRGLGELMILDVHPETATGIITLALEDVHLGDQVEIEGAAATAESDHPNPIVHKQERKWYQRLYKPW